MKKTVFGYQPKDYLIQLHYWAKRLDATEMVVYRDHSVSLYENNDCICYKYKPSARELACK